jgi:aspartokinase
VPKHLLIDRISELASITLTLPSDHLYIPGVYYTLLKALAWENINLIEALSGYSEITIVVKEKDSDRAFSCIKNLTAK